LRIAGKNIENLQNVCRNFYSAGHPGRGRYFIGTHGAGKNLGPFFDFPEAVEFTEQLHLMVLI
jgi:hypothetical protein